MKNLVSHGSIDKREGWFISHEQLSHLGEGAIETLFSLGNGTLGTRGTSSYESHLSTPECEGTYINGAYMREAIEYDESAYGFAKFNNKMLQVANTKSIEISTGHECFTPCAPSKKYLNLHQASFNEEIELSTPTGNRIKLFITRLICQHQANIMINHYTIKAVNYRGKLSIKSFIISPSESNKDIDDPRVGNLSTSKHLQLVDTASSSDYSFMLHRLHAPQSLIIAATSHQFEQNNQPINHHTNSASIGANTLTDQFDLEINDTVIELTKYSLYETNQNTATDKKESNLAASEIIEKSRACLLHCVQLGFEKNLQLHQQAMQKFWYNSDVLIDGNKEHQLAIRLNMLHLNMSAGKDGKRNIAAKGLTGPGYDGHYFWDSEIYITPYFIYTQPETARSLLSYRFNGLAKAKNRAIEMGHEQGVLFPWRTISGEECSSYFPAGTAQYHINSAVAYAVKHYFSATQDWQFIWDEGAELVFETARLWPSLGHFNGNKQDQFCLDMVTGPDEYTAMVNNNYYTNAMAKIHLSFAVELIDLLQGNNQAKCTALLQKLALSNKEISIWQKISTTMYLPHHIEKNISPQDDSFLDKKAWNFAYTAKDKYPLLLNFHPLVIYRHQVLKQADVVLANFLQDDEVAIELKRNNLAFYEPLTTHDSTLSACAHSLAYSETGDHQAAFNYFKETLLTDLNNLHNNTHYGVHTAAMAGSWMCVVQGFAGLRIRKNYISFQPKLPSQWQNLKFKLKLLGCQIQIELTDEHVTYQLLSGENLSLKHFHQSFSLTAQQTAMQFQLEKAN
ncbi:MAG: glycosyl hydrolase [Gammaproteobacteria bacterium]|nr:MAG: glycosyl hydrolase [Gammaproteobacteria bacterium]